MSDDMLDPQPDGTFIGVIAGVEIKLRRPTIGEQREFIATLENHAAYEQDWQAKRAELVDNGEVTHTELRKLDSEHQRVMEDRLIDWWRTVIDTLNTAGTRLPESNDDLPTWLLATSLTVEMRRAWLTVPWTPGGSPTQREAERSARALSGALAELNRTQRS